VNNENSRIPQELSDFYLPLLCGPEIAVAATKSFTSQVAILYLIAASFAMSEQKIRENLLKAKDLMTETIETRMGDIETVAAHLYAAPSLHILGTGLIGLAREGALKIREVVLNHTEGYDAAEFKHGPNTILGRNTILSLADIEKLVGREAVSGITNELFEKLTNNYPLVFICPPEERDRRITISQIHTHKIRGADIVLIAEPQQELALAVEGKPMGMESIGRSTFRSRSRGTLASSCSPRRSCCNIWHIACRCARWNGSIHSVFRITVCIRTRRRMSRSRSLWISELVYYKEGEHHCGAGPCHSAIIGLEKLV